jgi:hypothetical protein
MVAASVVSETLGDKDQRTTNAMPYPKNAAASETATVKHSYAYAQMLAGAMALSDHADLAFMPLLAIQLAPRMMTLVRKGLASSEAYHFVYACALAALALGMAAAAVRTTEGMWASVFTLACGWAAHELRLRLRAGRNTTWLLAPAAGFALVFALRALLPETIATGLVVGALSLVLQRFQPIWLSGEWLLARKLKLHMPGKTTEAEQAPLLSAGGAQPAEKRAARRRLPCMRPRPSTCNAPPA